MFVAMPKAPYIKKSFKKIAISFVLFIVMLLGIWFFIQYKLIRAGEQTYYKAFGIGIPNGYTINGIDVSKYQSYIYWKSVKKMKIDDIKIDFAFIKATEGTNTIDAMYKRNWQLSKECGVTRGAYHFFIATKDGKQQAKHFIDNVVLQKGDLPPVVDIEENYDVSNDKLTQRLQDFLDVVEEQYGVKPIIYSYANFYENYLSQNFSAYPLWIAHYTNANKPEINNHWQFWQHSEEGRVNGITEKVDFNVFNGTDSDFNKLLVK